MAPNMELAPTNGQQQQPKKTAAAPNGGNANANANVGCRQRRAPSGGPQRRNSARQLYRRYVNQSNIFARPADRSQSKGRWPPPQKGLAPIRLADSNPSLNQLEWQKQRRAHVRQVAMNTPTGTLNGPKIVQRHAEMRSYLLHCQRVLNARPRIDTGRLAAGRPAAMSSLTSPSIDGSWEAGGAGTGYDDVDGGIMSRGRRARSVPSNGQRRRDLTFEALEEENRHLLERLVQIGTRVPSATRRYDSSLEQSRQSTAASQQQLQQLQQQQTSKKSKKSGNSDKRDD